MNTEENEEQEGFTLPEGAEDVQPTTEPRLTQLDEASRSIILNIIYKYKLVRDEATGKLEKLIVGINYPDLEKALAYAGSHLNSVMKYSHSQALGILGFWEGLFYDPLWQLYDNNLEAKEVLNILNLNLQRHIMGGSYGGTHQDYNVKMAGAHRTFEVRKGG